MRFLEHALGSFYPHQELICVYFYVHNAQLMIGTNMKLIPTPPSLFRFHKKQMEFSALSGEWEQTLQRKKAEVSISPSFLLLARKQRYPYVSLFFALNR